MTEPGSPVLSLDLNPVIVRAQGEGCLCVDGVVLLDAA